MDFCRFQIGQCRITVDIKKTTEYYSEQNLITDDCDCEFCKHYSENVINKDVRAFKILKNMGVDLSKNENNQLENVWHTGPREKFKNSYIHHYKIFGTIYKTTKTTLKVDENNLKTVEYFENELDSFCHYIFRQINNEEIDCQINIECDRI